MYQIIILSSIVLSTPSHGFTRESVEGFLDNKNHPTWENWSATPFSLVTLLKSLDIRIEWLGSMVRINGWFHLLINGVYWGYNPLILTFDPNFLGHLSKQSDLINWSRWWFQIFFLFSPLLAEMIQFDEHIFQLGWNHQPVKITLIALTSFRAFD